jgi:hypothetical protein
MIGLKGASGLGDSIYAVPIAEYYSKKHDVVHIMSNYPELFKHITNVKCYKHEKLNYIRNGQERIPIDHRFTYCGRKYTAGSSQFEDSYMSIGIKDKLKLELPWIVKNTELIESVIKKADKKAICILSAPYEPFGREDCWGQLLRINPRMMCQIVDEFKDRVFFIQVGNRFALHKIPGVDMDMIGNTSVSDLLDLVKIADIGLSQIGNLLPICEALNTHNMIIFSHQAMISDNKFLAAIKPEKVVHYKRLNRSVVDGRDKNHIRMFNELINAS